MPQSVAVCCGSVRNKRVAVVGDVVVYRVCTDRGRWRIRRSRSTRTSRRRAKSGIWLCSSSGGARVMTRLFTVVKPVKPWLESVADRFEQIGGCRVEAFAVRFLVEPCVCRRWIIRGDSESDIFGRSLNSIVREGIQAKLSMMPENARFKLQETLERIVNEGSGGLIAIIL